MFKKIRSRRLRAHCRVVGALAIALALLSPAAASQAAAAPAAPTPSAVTGLTVSGTPVATTLNVSWTPAASGAPATGYLVWVQDETGALSLSATCAAPCGSRLFPALAPGHWYRARLTPFNASGSGASSTSAYRPVVSGCVDATPACVTVNATQPQGAAIQRAQGFLFATGRVVYGVSELRPQWWRTHSIDGNYQDFDLATRSGAQTVLLVSDAWLVDGYNAARGGVVAPWEDWAHYRQWVHDYATSFVRSGRLPAYWEVMNEPGFETYLNENGATEATPARVLEQYRVAYQEIKAVDANAKIVGPSLERYFSYPGLYGPNLLDMATFLDFAKANNVRPAAVVWHEIEVNWAKADPTVLPVDITEHVADARALLAARGMSDIKVVIDEYGAPATYAMPGWTVGYLAALEAANVDGAMRSCWDAPSANGGTYSQCDRGLDGLYAENNTTPLPNYWVHAAYAAMTGTRVAATPSTARLSAFAVQDTKGVVRALIGRHESCTAILTRDCPGGTGSAPPPMPVALTVVLAPIVKTASVKVTRTGLWDSNGPVLVSDSVVAVAGGKLSLSLPQVSNGDSYSVTVTPIS